MKKKLAFFILNAFLLVLTLPKRLLARSKDVAEIKPRKILLIRLDYIGDVVMTSPAFSFLQSRFPESNISLLTNSVAKELYKNDANIDKIWVYNWPWRFQRSDNGFNKAKVKQLFQVIRTLRKERFDLVVDPRGDSRFLFLFGALIGAKTKIGNSRTGNCGLLDFMSQYDTEKHEIERSFDVLRCFKNPPVTLRPYVSIPDEELDRAKALTQKLAGRVGHPKVALIAPFSSKDVKSWPLDYFKDVIAHLLTQKYLVIVVGTKDDAKDALLLTDLFSKNVYSLAGKTSILELAALTSVSQLVVGVDTGVLHIAACFSTPIVAIFGPTRSCEYRPYSKYAVVADSQSCVCDQFTHQTCDVLTNGYARCMTQALPSLVIRRIDEITIQQLKAL
ncbi:MAG: glycosyltransferase family 9 protein [Imperialibacter sp.]|uniref:glycosyltransferase family 9 protein n=1 Tax=Imperialibacter sp. TaxID=2038411 RepID=UPI0032EFFA57